jgi:hypothetical protein
MTDFDLWLTRDRNTEGAEPSDAHYDKARAELGFWASDEQINNMAYDLLAEEIEQSERDEGESRADAREEEYGDGP